MQWKKWIPSSEAKNFVQFGGFQKQLHGGRLRVFSLNTVLYHVRNKAFKDVADPCGQMVRPLCGVVMLFDSVDVCVGGGCRRGCVTSWLLLALLVRVCSSLVTFLLLVSIIQTNAHRFHSLRNGKVELCLIFFCSKRFRRHHRKPVIFGGRFINIRLSICCMNSVTSLAIHFGVMLIMIVNLFFVLFFFSLVFINYFFLFVEKNNLNSFFFNNYSVLDWCATKHCKLNIFYHFPRYFKKKSQSLQRKTFLDDWWFDGPVHHTIAAVSVVPHWHNDEQRIRSDRLFATLFELGHREQSTQSGVDVRVQFRADLRRVWFENSQAIGTSQSQHVGQYNGLNVFVFVFFPLQNDSFFSFSCH